MIKAFSLSGPKPRSQEHRILQADRSDGSSESENDSEQVSETQIAEDSVDNVFTFLLEYDPCFSHTMQIPVRDGMREVRSLHKIIAKVSALVAYVKKLLMQRICFRGRPDFRQQHQQDGILSLP